MRLRELLRDRGLRTSSIKECLSTGKVRPRVCKTAGKPTALGRRGGPLKVFLDGVPTSDGGRVVSDPSRVAVSAPACLAMDSDAWLHAVITLYLQVRPDAPRLTPGRDVAFVHKDPHLVVRSMARGAACTGHVARAGRAT